MSGTGVKKDLFNNSATANSLEQMYGSQAAGANAVLTPALEAEAINPQGYNPSQMAAQTTAAEQSAGGSNSGAVGGAMLRAARTRNAGAVGAETSEAGRGASQDLSQINAGIQTRNADLQQKQKQAGLSGLAGVYGEDVGAGNQALGLSNQALGEAGQQKPGYWQQYWQNAMTNSANSAPALLMGGA